MMMMEMTTTEFTAANELEIMVTDMKIFFNSIQFYLESVTQLLPQR